MSVSYGGDSITFADNSTISSGWTGFKNRVINGSITIDQRYAGSANTPADNGALVMDRWASSFSQASKFSVQQVADAPAGFYNSAKITSLAATSSGTNDYWMFRQKIEGYNLIDFNLGLSSAITFTLSFWVKSSLTGTFGGAFINNSSDRSYAYTYTINSANTWEYKTITVTGDTTGTWQKTTSSGLEVRFGLGVGTTYSGAAGSWASANYVSATGATSVVGTNGATWQITGVQIEKGSSASSFEYRPYGTELAMCQRYYSTVYLERRVNCTAGSQYFGMSYPFPVPMRTAPTATYTTSSYNNTSGSWQDYTVLDNMQGRAQGTSSSSGDTYIFSTFKLNAEL